MEGNDWENSIGVRKEVCSNDDVEDGDEGPSMEGDTKEWDVRSFWLFACHPRV